MEIFYIAAGIMSILGGFFALMAWVQARSLKKEYGRDQDRQNKKIKVVLQLGDRSLELPGEFRRADLTRAEILGRIGMIPRKTKEKFSVRYFNTPEFFSQINQIMTSDGDAILTISCTEDEFQQFDV